MRTAKNPEPDGGTRYKCFDVTWKSAQWGRSHCTKTTKPQQTPYSGHRKQNDDGGKGGNLQADGRHPFMKHWQHLMASWGGRLRGCKQSQDFSQEVKAWSQMCPLYELWRLEYFCTCTDSVCSSRCFQMFGVQQCKGDATKWPAAKHRDGKKTSLNLLTSTFFNKVWCFLGEVSGAENMWLHVTSCV